MRQAAKIRVIKKSAKSDIQTKSGDCMPLVVPPPRDVFQNVSDWVREVQTRKREEDRTAAALFFSSGAQGSKM